MLTHPNSNYNALNTALKVRNFECAQYLVEQKSDVNIFSSARRQHFFNSMMFWIDAEPSIILRDNWSSHWFPDAKEREHLTIKQNRSLFNALVKAGVNLNAVSTASNNTGATSTLSWVLKTNIIPQKLNNENTDAIIKLLIEHKADPFFHTPLHLDRMSFFEELLFLSKNELVDDIAENHPAKITDPETFNEMFINLAASGHVKLLKHMFSMRDEQNQPKICPAILVDAFTHLVSTHIPQEHQPIPKVVSSEMGLSIANKPFGMRRTYETLVPTFKIRWGSSIAPLLNKLDEVRNPSSKPGRADSDMVGHFRICEQLKQCLPDLTEVAQLFLKHIDLSDPTKFASKFNDFYDCYSPIFNKELRNLDNFNQYNIGKSKVLFTSAKLVVSYILFQEWIQRKHITLLHEHINKSEQGEKENKLDTYLFLDTKAKRAEFTTDLLKETKIKDVNFCAALGWIVEMFFRHSQAPYFAVMSESENRLIPKFTRLPMPLRAKVLSYVSGPQSNNPALLQMFNRQTLFRLNHIDQLKARAKAKHN